jgi:Ca2+-binding RTX toxin-like protein
MATINGTELADTLTGGLEADLIEALAGSDDIRGGGGADTINGGNDVDGADGEAGDDLIFGDQGDDVLLGGAGADTLNGGDGADNLLHDGGGLSAVTSFVSNPNGGVSIPRTNFGGLDTLRDDGAADVLNGGAGDDRATVGLNDSADGGDGTDTLFVNFSARSSALNLDMSADAQAALGAASGGSFTNFENLGALGTSQGDLMIGDAGANVLVGGLGSDTLRGGDGADVLMHGEGVFPNGNRDNRRDDDVFDVLEGGPGNDSVFIGIGDAADGGDGVDHVFASFLARATGLDLDLGADSNAALSVAVGGPITNFERFSITGTEFGDRVIGDAETQNLYGRGGDDTLDGAGGRDLLGGNQGNDVLYGGAGNDLILDGEGDDFSYGGEGDDILSLGQTGFVGEPTTIGNDFADGGAGNDVIYGEGGRDTLVGGAGADQIYAGSGNDVIYAHTSYEGEGYAVDTDRDNDTIFAGGGDDLIWASVGDVVDGGSGVDYAILNFARQQGALSINLGLAASGTAELSGAAGRYTSIEAFTFWGGEAGDSIVGGARADTLLGELGDDTLRGGAGDDYLHGHEGVDVLDGGDGFDRVSFFSYWLPGGVQADLRSGVVTNDGWGNTETLTSIEALGGGGRFTDVFHGNDADNFLPADQRRQRLGLRLRPWRRRSVPAGRRGHSRRRRRRGHDRDVHWRAADRCERRRHRRVRLRDGRGHGEPGGRHDLQRRLGPHGRDHGHREPWRFDAWRHPERRRAEQRADRLCRRRLAERGRRGRHPGRW